MAVKLYVVGFAFNKKGDHVVLVHKDRPEWQAGLINGVGGKVEDTDLEYIDAMTREFFEETGMFTVAPDWDHFATLHFENDKLGGEAMVFAYRIFTDDIWTCQTKESEKIEIFELPKAETWKGFRSLAGLELVPHTYAILPIARDKAFKFCEFKMQ